MGLQGLPSPFPHRLFVFHLRIHFNNFTTQHTFDELDHDKKAEGCALDELQAHRFLERHNETLTVHAMRERLRATGAIGAQVRLVPLIHVLLFKYNADWHHLVSASHIFSLFNRYHNLSQPDSTARSQFPFLISFHSR